MKKITSLVALLALFALTAILPAVALNPIESYAGPCRVVILSSTDAFGAEHAVRPFRSISQKRNGQPYLATNTPAWWRYTDSDGVIRESQGSDFPIRLWTKMGLDGDLIESYRTFPPESIEKVATAKEGDTVYVVSLANQTTETATVTGLRPSEYTIDVSYSAKPGDSGSFVLTRDGTFVGVISAAYLSGNGSSVSVPPPTAIQSVPPPPVAPPTPTPTPILPVIQPPTLPPALKTYDQGYSDGLAKGFILGQHQTAEVSRGAVAEALKVALDAINAKLVGW